MKKVKTSLVTVRKEDVEIKPVESVKYLFLKEKIIRSSMQRKIRIL